jgi:hypothetical protein
MFRKLVLAIAMMACSTSAFALGKLQGYAELGGQSVSVAGFSSTTKVQKTFPGATVTVYLGGTTTLATIYADEALTDKGNPFTADAASSTTPGFWFFYAADGTYDVKFSGTGITTPWTISGLDAGDSASAAVDITSYGAVADGVTNNDTAITNAITAVAAAGGGEVIVPCTSSSFLLTSAVTLTSLSNIAIVGRGLCSHITVNLLDSAFEVASSTGIQFRNLYISGTMARGIAVKASSVITLESVKISGCTLSAPQSFGAPSSDFAAAFYMTNTTDVLLDDVTFTGNGFGTSNTVSSTDFISTGAAQRIRVQNSRLISTSVTMNIIIQTDAAGQTNHTHWVTNNDIGGAITKTNNTAWGYGVAVYHSSSTVSEVWISKNRINGTGGNGVYVPANTDIHILNNRIENTCQTVTGGALAEGAIGVASDIVLPALATDIEIVGNIIKTSGKAGIRCDCGDAVISLNDIDAVTGAAISLNRIFDNVSITSNIITNATGGGIVGVAAGSGSNWIVSRNIIGVTGTGAAAYGISLVNITNNLTCDGNIINSAGSYGVLLQTVNGFTLSNTKIINASNNANNSFDGVFLNSVTAGTVTGNVVADTSFGSCGAGTPCVRYALSVNNSTDVEVGENQLFGWATGGFLNNASTRVGLDGNHYTSGARQGSVALVAGAATVSTVEVQAGDTIVLNVTTVGGTPGWMHVSAITAGTSFVITSSNALDTSTVQWKIVH